MFDLTDAEWAWVAGLFEGEGTIGIQRRSKVVLRIQMNDRDVLEHLDRLVPSPNGIKACDWRGRKICYRWTLCTRAAVEAFFRGIGPWMGSRRSVRIAEALEAVRYNRAPSLAQVEASADWIGKMSYQQLAKRAAGQKLV